MELSESMKEDAQNELVHTEKSNSEEISQNEGTIDESEKKLKNQTEVEPDSGIDIKIESKIEETIVEAAEMATSEIEKPVKTEVPEKPEVETEISEKPEVETEISEKPKVETEISEKSEVETEISETPEVETEISEKPEVETEICEKPEVETEISEKPEVQPESSEKPEVETEISEKPEVETKISKKPEVETAISEKPEVDTEISEKLDAETEISEKPEVSTEISDKAEVETEISEKSEIKIETAQAPKIESQEISEESSHESAKKSEITSPNNENPIESESEESSPSSSYDEDILMSEKYQGDSADFTAELRKSSISKTETSSIEVFKGMEVDIGEKILSGDSEVEMRDEEGINILSSEQSIPLENEITEKVTEKSPETSELSPEPEKPMISDNTSETPDEKSPERKKFDVPETFKEIPYVPLNFDDQQKTVILTNQENFHEKKVVFEREIASPTFGEESVPETNIDTVEKTTKIVVESTEESEITQKSEISLEKISIVEQAVETVAETTEKSEEQEKSEISVETVVEKQTEAVTEKANFSEITAEKSSYSEETADAVVEITEQQAVMKSSEILTSAEKSVGGDEPFEVITPTEIESATNDALSNELQVIPDEVKREESIGSAVEIVSSS